MLPFGPLLLSALAAASSAPAIELRAHGLADGGTLIEAAFEAQASLETAWEVLTDYGEQPRFLSSIRESRVLSRRRRDVLLRQAARLRWLVRRRTLSVTLRIRERPRSLLAFSDLGGGDFRRYAGAWRLSGGPESVLVAYRLDALPRSRVPGPLTRAALAREARARLEELRVEILRRHQAKPRRARRNI